MYELNGREVEVTETHFEHGEGAHVVSAMFVDDETELTDKECEELTEIYQSDLYEDAYVDLAAAAYDHYKDMKKYGDM